MCYGYKIQPQNQIVAFSWHYNCYRSDLINTSRDCCSSNHGAPSSSQHKNLYYWDSNFEIINVYLCVPLKSQILIAPLHNCGIGVVSLDTNGGIKTTTTTTKRPSNYYSHQKPGLVSVKLSNDHCVLTHYA